MGVTNALYDWGFQYDDPKKPYHMEGFVNSPDAVKGLEFYKSLYKCCTAPGMSNAYMSEGLDAFKSGQVAMQMNFFAFCPGFYKDLKVGGEKICFFVISQGLVANIEDRLHPDHLDGTTKSPSGIRSVILTLRMPSAVGRMTRKQTAGPYPVTAMLPRSAVSGDIPGGT